MSSARDEPDPGWCDEPARVSPEDLCEDVWALLREQAVAALDHAYVPYSSYPVGAAALVDDGRIVRGCNIENASYGVTLCAECTLVSELMMTGGGRLVAFDCIDGNGRTLSPCGRCRQLLVEHAAPDLVLNMPSGRVPMTDVLPEAFGPEQLRDHAESRATARTATDNPAAEATTAAEATPGRE